MSKDTFWFKHDAGASRDIKLLKLRHTLGYWGIGVYWTLIETLREQTDYKYPSDLKSKNLLCAMFGISEEKFDEFLKECFTLDLLVDKYGFLYSESLVSRMSVWERNKKNGSQPKAKRKPNGSQTPNIRGDKIRKEEESAPPIRGDAPIGETAKQTPPLPPLHKKDITEEECIALIQIPYRNRTDTQNAQVYNYTITHPEFDSDKHKPVGRDS